MGKTRGYPAIDQLLRAQVVVTTFSGPSTIHAAQFRSDFILPTNIHKVALFFCHFKSIKLVFRKPSSFYPCHLN